MNAAMLFRKPFRPAVYGNSGRTICPSRYVVSLDRGLASRSLWTRPSPSDGAVVCAVTRPVGAYLRPKGVFRIAQSRRLSSNSQPPEKDNRSSKPPLRERIKALTPHENIYTIPNILTFSRLAAAPVIGYLVLNGHDTWAAGLFAYAGITDLVDGWIARTFKQQTVVGTVIDPMADKTLMTILTVSLAIKGTLPIWCATIIIGRDVLLAISAIYYRWISLPPPKTFARYWDFSLPSAEVRPTGISKINTALQLGLIGWTVCMPMLTIYGPWVAMSLTGMQYLVASTTIWSGLSYIYTKDAVKILSAEDIEERQRQSRKKE